MGMPFISRRNRMMTYVVQCLRQPLASHLPSEKDVDMLVLEKLRQVIGQLIKPSWVRAVPPNFGAASAGTPKADEWRMLFTVYLPIALIRLWSHHPPHDRRRQVLEHTMHLVSAIVIVCRQSMTDSLARAYQRHLTEWVKGIALLYPDAAAVPNIHMAFHVYDGLILYGPVRSWWTFPFERVVGLVQRLISNHIYGKFAHLFDFAY
jgi:hypothetical protein